MSTQELKAPTPIGGVVLDIDFVPSIVFAALYGCFLPFIIWRFVRADRRTVLQITTIVFAIERVRVFAFAPQVLVHSSDTFWIDRSSFTACVRVRHTAVTEGERHVVFSSTYKFHSRKATSACSRIYCRFYVCS